MIYNQDGTCYDYFDFSVCSYAGTGIWILCPNNYTVCYSYNYLDATCCLADGEYCSQDPTVSQATCVPGVYIPSGEPIVCGGIVCGDAGNLCCNDANIGPTCYDQVDYTCQPSNVGSVLCPKQDNTFLSACGRACYDPSVYTCCSNNLYQTGQPNPCNSSTPTHTPSPSVTPAPSPTSTHTASPSASTCNCGANDACCVDVNLGPTCYDRTLFNCTEGSDGLKLCGFINGHAAACSTICFDISNYQCCGGERLIQKSQAC